MSELTLTKFEQSVYKMGTKHWEGQLNLSTIILVLLIISIIFLIWQKAKLKEIAVIGVLTFACFFYCVYSSKACTASENVEEKVNYALRNIEEQLVTEEIIEICAFNASEELEGSLSGEYRLRQGTIYGELTNNTKLKYTGVNKDGSLYKDSIPYSKDNVFIFENDAELPRIEVRTYKKQALDKIEQRTEYTVYIPVGTLSEL